MALKQERKFLVDTDSIDLEKLYGKKIIQMYLVDKPDHSVKIRIINEVKAEICYSFYLSKESKEEHEFDISVFKGLKIYNEKSYFSILEKNRYHKEGWEIDKYNNGLIIAKFEFSEEKTFPEVLPNWIDEEITGVERYTNPGIARVIKEGRDLYE